MNPEHQTPVLVRTWKHGASLVVVAHGVPSLFGVIFIRTIAQTTENVIEGKGWDVHVDKPQEPFGERIGP